MGIREDFFIDVGRQMASGNIAPTTLDKDLLWAAKWGMERSASHVERLSPYFKEAPEACYQECVNDVANKLRQLAKEME